MSLTRVILVIFFTLGTLSCASMGEGSKGEKQQKILSMKEAVLTQLFKNKPSAREHLNQSAGYAVFSNANINLFFVAAGAGYGVVKDMSSGQQTFMNMAEGGVGLGLGAKDYRVVMVFNSKESLNTFINSGWSLGGNADAAAKASHKGASIEGEAHYGDVTVYTFTETGLALQATVKGTKFWKDKALN